jgi:DNA mismatch repair protein MutH
MKSNRKYSEEEIGLIVQNTLGKTFGELNNYELKSFDKGSFGHIFEENVFEYAINNDSEPDFIESGIELKVTPYKYNKKGIPVAKERLVLNIIDYMNEYKNEFITSHFWFKNNKLQIIWYLWEEDKKQEDFRITHQVLLKLENSKDLKQIQEDWNYIVTKIKEGKAHELSEADTMYLGACTKGANASSLREQPFSNIKAKQRAFCFKLSYMTQLVKQYIGKEKENESVLKGDESLSEHIVSVINQYKGKSQKDLMKIFSIESDSKNLNSMIVCRMFGIKGQLEKTDEFLKANIVPRTVRIENNNRIKESMPFSAFDYCELAKEEWENSELRNMFETTKYMFFIFKNNGVDYIFKGIKLWNMPEVTIENDIKTVWEKTRDSIRNGNIVKDININGIRTTNFPGMKENDVCHVRPHARDAQDTFRLPVPDKLTGLTSYTKHCFWLNSKYLEMILSEYFDMKE